MALILPTLGHSVRGIRKDSEGDGHFMAKRGKRMHKGFDLLGDPGKEIVAPFDCKFDRLYRPYATDPRWRGCFLKGDNLWIGMFYMTPYDALIGKKLRAGQEIGIMQNISEKYGDSMLPHIHVETIIPPLRCLDNFKKTFGGMVYVDPQLFFEV